MIKRPLQNPNDLNLRRTDAKVTLGVCPLMKSTVQLRPQRLRYIEARGDAPMDLPATTALRQGRQARSETLLKTRTDTER